MTTKIHHVEWFHDFQSDHMVGVIVLLPETGDPVVVYLYESKGWYNCYTSLDLLLRREYNDDYSIDFSCIETRTADDEDGREEFEAFLIEKFITNPIPTTE